MDVAVISHGNEASNQKLVDAFKAKNLTSQLIDISSIGVFIEKNASHLFHDPEDVSNYDSIFLNLPLEFTLFVEPFLSETVDEGKYCQLKPTAFYILSNKPFLYSMLNSKGVSTPKTDIIADPEAIDSNSTDFSFPLIIKTFLGLKKTNSVLLESERSLRSFVKSISLDLDAITIQEYLEGDVDQILVIGDSTYAVKRRWVEKELHHSKKPISTALSDADSEMAIKAARVSGMDIGVVKMINGKVIGVRNSVNFDMFSDVLSTSMYAKIAEYYKQKLKEGY